jgi:hypothetical protein
MKIKRHHNVARCACGHLFDVTFFPGVVLIGEVVCPKCAGTSCSYVGDLETREISAEDAIKDYPHTDTFKCTDILFIPHPYTIGNRLMHHIDSMVISEDTIRAAEAAARPKSTAWVNVKPVGLCGHDKCSLTYDEHEIGILVEIGGVDAAVLRQDLNEVAGLKDYLLRLRPLVETDGFSGFGFRPAPMEIHGRA